MNFSSILSLFVIILLILLGIKITCKFIKFIIFVGVVIFGVVFLMSTGAFNI